ncbi:MAG: hypothetical protein WC566_05755 [Dehalococcoidia bacterium]
MRAAAVDGVTLEKGIHRGFGGDSAITIKYPNGMRQEIPFYETAVATPVLIEAMIADIGPENPETKAAVKEYCLDYVRRWNKIIEDPEIDGIQICTLRNLVDGFIAGYECVKSPADCLVTV